MEEIKENLSIPVEVLEEFSVASMDLLSEKIKERYQKKYEDFKDWRKMKSVEAIDEVVAK